MDPDPGERVALGSRETRRTTRRTSSPFPPSISARREVTRAAYRLIPHSNLPAPRRRAEPRPVRKNGRWVSGAGAAARAVTRVTRDEALAYCRWLSAQTGRRCRLPTEGMGSRARGGIRGARWPWGWELRPGAWCCDTTGAGAGRRAVAESPRPCSTWRLCSSGAREHPRGDSGAGRRLVGTGSGDGAVFRRFFFRPDSRARTRLPRRGRRGGPGSGLRRGQTIAR
jgi:hypothetical protein